MSEELIGLIPAAGKGIRLGLPYPKELYPIIRDNRYKPVSQFVVENLTGSGIEHIVFVINETKHQLIGYFGDGSRFHCHISYVVQEQRENGSASTSPGLAHALNSAYYLVRNKVVCFGMADTIIAPTDAFCIAMERSSASLILGLFDTDRPEKFGMVDLDSQGYVREIVDKPRTTDLKFMWGFIIWKPVFTEYLHDCVQREVYDFARIMNQAIKDGIETQGVIIDNGGYTDLGTYEEIMELERTFRAI